MKNLNNLTQVGAEILIADASVDQLDVLLSGLRSSVQIRLLNPHDDVISLLVQAISSSNLDTLHLLGHGAPGEIILGGKVINLSSLDEIKNKYGLQFNVLVADCEGFLERFFDENPELYNEMEKTITKYTDVTNFNDVVIKIFSEMINNRLKNFEDQLSKFITTE